MKPETKVKNIQRALNQEPNGAGLKVDGIIGPKTRAAFTALEESQINYAKQHGKAGWYSQYQGKYKWVDKGDGKWNADKTVYLGPNNALGVPDDEQGIALPSSKGLGLWFNVASPTGKVLRLRQTDIGPSSWTGRKIDIAAVAAERFGYSPSNFPTDEGLFTWWPA